MEVKNYVKYILLIHPINDKTIFLVGKIVIYLIQKLPLFIKALILKAIYMHCLDRLNQLLEEDFNQIYRVQNLFNLSRGNIEIAIRLLDKIH